jgi:hypothetical protein
MVDCSKCVNRGKAFGLSQESNCDHCIHFMQTWKRDLYDEGPNGGKAHKNCDGCARLLPVVGGLHRDEKGAVQTCTANRYT